MLSLNKNDSMNFNDGKNYSEFDNICSALKETLPDFDIRTLKPYLWRDEIKDIFMLTQKAEIYLYNRYILNCYSWSHNVYRRANKLKLSFDNHGCDDTGLYQFKSDIFNLPELLKLCGEIKRRMSVRSLRRQQLEERLGHKISKCEPNPGTWKTVQKEKSYGSAPNFHYNPPLEVLQIA